ncbi:MAG: hypothetical protein H6767_05590 [Candidatus Peribacteria bacterium]|nr:MAG: hypothetical protein H6767_05590 [Candidatus Peribacteria bacterium]
MKQTARDFFVQHGFYDLYTYSFVHAELMTKLGEDMSGLIELKNQLSEEQSHMRGSLIPNLLLSLEKNIRDSRHLQLFEVERVFTLEKDGKINEYDELAAVMTSEKQVVYYDMQNLVSECLHELGVDNYFFEPVETAPSYAHRTRSAHIVVRGKIIGIIGEIHPKIARNFDVHDRIGFFSLNLSLLSESSFNLIRYKEISQYQENNFDLSFVVEKNTKGREISLAISKVNPTLIQKVELFDIYEDALRLPGKRSLSFKIWIQSESETLSDEVKNTLIQDIVKKVEKK